MLKFLKKEYYLLPWCLVVEVCVIIYAAYLESKLVRSMLLLTSGSMHSIYRYSMLILSIIIISICVVISWAVWVKQVNIVSRGRVDRCLMYLIWMMISIFCCIPLSMGLLCNWSFQAVWLSVGKVVTVALIMADFCEGCLLIFCMYYRLLES